MKPFKFARTPLSAIGMALMLCIVLSTFTSGRTLAAGPAVNHAQAAESQLQKPSEPPAPDEVRSQVFRLLNILDAAEPQVARLSNQVARARQQFDALTDGQWKALAEHFDLPTFSRAVDALDSIAIVPATSASARANGKLFTARPKTSNQGGSPVMNSALPPPEYDECGDTRSNTIAGITLRATAQSLEAVAIPLDALCASIVVLLGEGGSNVEACVAAAAAHLAVLAIRVVTEDFDFCDSVINGVEISATLKNTEIIHGDLEFSIANDNANRAAIIANDNANRAAIITNDNANTAAIIANDNANTAAIIANDNANKNELRDLILRTQIEADLAQEGAVSVAAFVTPNANGGYLDLTRALVVQAIANIRAAGGSVGQADSFLAQGDAAKAAGQFKTAYVNYRKAYKAAVN